MNPSSDSDPKLSNPDRLGEPSLSIVIVNWNSGTLLRECIASIEAGGFGAACDLEAVVVVDNGSTDRSYEDLQSRRATLRVVRNATNRGFAAACNQGAAETRSDFLLFLNPDTRLFPNSIRIPITYLSAPQQSDVGIVGIQLLDADGRVSRCAARFPTPAHFAVQCLGLDRAVPAYGQLMREWDHASTRRVDQVIGAYFLVRRKVYDELGGFDERFFVYFEEVDFALRARRAGWASVFLADVQAFHLGGGVSRQVRARRLFYSLRSRLQYGAKHYSAGQRLVLSATTWLLEPLSRSIYALVRGRFRELTEVVEAYRLLACDRRGGGAQRVPVR